MDFQIDNSWRVLDEDNGPDKQMHALVKDDAANVCHFLQQFGLGLACVEEELKFLFCSSMLRSSLPMLMP